MWTFWIMSIFSGICCFSTFWTLYSPENIRQTCFWKINLLTKGWGCVWEIRKGEVKTWNLLSHISVSEGGKCSLQLLLCTLCKCCSATATLWTSTVTNRKESEEVSLLWDLPGWWRWWLWWKWGSCRSRQCHCQWMLQQFRKVTCLVNFNLLCISHFDLHCVPFICFFNSNHSLVDICSGPWSLYAVCYTNRRIYSPNVSLLIQSPRFVSSSTIKLKIAPLFNNNFSQKWAGTSTTNFPVFL